MLIFVIGAVALSIGVLWKRQNCLVLLLGLLGWAVIASWMTMFSVFSCLVYPTRVPCPIMLVLSAPLRIQWSIIAYRCPNCVGYDIQIWLGGLWCWEGVSSALRGDVMQMSWLSQAIFPWFLWLAVFEALVVFTVVWGGRFAVSRLYALSSVKTSRKLSGTG